MSYSVTLLGSSSGRNAGDAALIGGIMESIDGAFNERLRYEIPTIRPSYIRENYRNDAVPIPMFPWNLSLKMLGLPTYQSIMRTDLSLVFDAVLFDRSLYNPLFNFLSTLYLFLPRAKKQGKRLGCFNVGAGPVDTAAGQRMLREVAENMDFITVRDQDSYDLLREIGVENPRLFLAADAALTVTASDASRVDGIMHELGLADASEFLAINVNTYIDTWARPKRPSMGRERFVAVYAEALNRVLKELQVPVLFVCTQHHDVSITEDIISRLDKSAKTSIISNRKYNHYEVKGVLGRASLLCAMRLHAMILASSELTPVVGIAYQPKCAYYFKSLGLSERMMGFPDYSVDSLSELIVSGWNDRQAIRSQLEQCIPVLKTQANLSGELVKALLTGESLEGIFNPAAGQTVLQQHTGV